MMSVVMLSVEKYLSLIWLSFTAFLVVISDIDMLSEWIYQFVTYQFHSCLNDG